MNNYRFKYIGKNIIKDNVQEGIFYKIVRTINANNKRIPNTEMYIKEPAMVALKLCHENGTIKNGKIICLDARKIHYKEEQIDKSKSR